MVFPPSSAKPRPKKMDEIKPFELSEESVVVTRTRGNSSVIDSPLVYFRLINAQHPNNIRTIMRNRYSSAFFHPFGLANTPTTRGRIKWKTSRRHPLSIPIPSILFPGSYGEWKCYYSYALDAEVLGLSRHRLYFHPVVFPTSFEAHLTFMKRIVQLTSSSRSKNNNSVMFKTLRYELGLFQDMYYENMCCFNLVTDIYDVHFRSYKVKTYVQGGVEYAMQKRKNSWYRDTARNKE